MAVPLGPRLWSALDLPAPSLAAGLLLILAVATAWWALGGVGVHVDEDPAVRVAAVDVEYAGVEATAARVAVVNPLSRPVVGTVTVSARAGAGEALAVARSRARFEPESTTVVVRFDAPVPAGRFEAVRVRVTPGVGRRTTGSRRTP